MLDLLAGFLLLILCVFLLSLIVMGWHSGKSFKGDKEFKASLAKNLPPVVVLPIFLGLIAILIALAIVSGGLGLGGAVGVAYATWTASIARTWLDRRKPGRVLADLSPYPLAGKVRRISWILSVVIALLICFGDLRQTAGEGQSKLLTPAVDVALVLVLLLTNLMYSDRVWLAERGLYCGGRLYPWNRFERVAWTDDSRAFGLRRRGRGPLVRWAVVPVQAGSRKAVEEALRQVMPASC